MAADSHRREMSLRCPQCRRTFSQPHSRCPEDGAELVSVEEADDPLSGLVLDEQYRLESLLGAGGMGKVYRATQLAVGRNVAVKVLRADLTESENAHRRFSQEAQTISSLTHPNVVQLIDFGTDKTHDILYLVMEYVRGRHLASLLDGKRLDTNLALEVLYQVCGGLAEPHDRGMIHRDLKPDNVQLMAMADGTLQAKVLDFGIVRCVEHTNRLTDSGVVCGTPAYLSPEQARGQAVDPRSDLYSLGVMLYEMLTGELPFHATRGFQLMLKHIREVAPSITDRISDDSRLSLVEPLVESLMAKSRRDRPSGVGEVRRTIEKIREELGVPLHRLPREIGEVAELEEMTHDVERPEDETKGGGSIRETDSSATTAGVYETIAPTMDPDDIRQPEQLAAFASNIGGPSRQDATKPIDVQAAADFANAYGRGTDTSFPPQDAGVEPPETSDSSPSNEYYVGPTQPDDTTLSPDSEAEAGASVGGEQSSTSVLFRNGALAAALLVVVGGGFAWLYSPPGGWSKTSSEEVPRENSSPKEAKDEVRERTEREEESVVEPAGSAAADPSRFGDPEEADEESGAEESEESERAEDESGSSKGEASATDRASAETDREETDRGETEGSSSETPTASTDRTGSADGRDRGSESSDSNPHGSKHESGSSRPRGGRRSPSPAEQDDESDPDEELEQILESGTLRESD